MSKVKVNLEGNFFDYNPEVMYFDGVNDLVRDKGKEFASKVMWAIYLTEDPTSSFYAFPLLDKRVMVQKNFLKDDDFNWGEYDELCKSYPSWFLSSIERNYKSINDTFTRMVSDLSSLDVTDAKEHKMTLDLLRAIKPTFESLSIISDMFKKEQETKKNTRGQDQAGGIARKSFK